MGKWAIGLLSSDIAWDACGHMEDWLRDNPKKTVNDYMLLPRTPDEILDAAGERERLLAIAAHAVNRRWPITALRSDIERALQVEMSPEVLNGWRGCGGRGNSLRYCRLIALSIFAAHWYGEDVSRIQNARLRDEDFPREIGEERTKRRKRRTHPARAGKPEAQPPQSSGCAAPTT